MTKIQEVVRKMGPGVGLNYSKWEDGYDSYKMDDMEILGMSIVNQKLN